MRRNRLTGHGADRFRNYGVVLERHERDQRLKKVFKVFMLFAIILILIMLLIIVFRVEQSLTPPKTSVIELSFNSDPTGCAVK